MMGGLHFTVNAQSYQAGICCEQATFFVMSTQNQEELVNSLFGIAPRVLAEQLTLRDVGFLKPLQLSEFEGSQGQVAWMKPNKLEISPNIIKAITYTNSVRLLVISFSSVAGLGPKNPPFSLARFDLCYQMD